MNIKKMIVNLKNRFGQWVRQNKYLRKPLYVIPVSEYGKFIIEDKTVVLHRGMLLYPSPSAAGLLTLKTGVRFDLKPGYCAILHFPESFAHTGLVPVRGTQVILPGDISEVMIPCYKSMNPHFADSPKSNSPFEVGDVMAFATIIRTA